MGGIFLALPGQVPEIRAVWGMGACFPFRRMLRLGQGAVSSTGMGQGGLDKQGRFRAKQSCLVIFTDCAWPGDRAAGHLCRSWLRCRATQNISC